MLCFSTMTMDELLQHLIMKTRYDCEEAHRRLVFASTGLAGLHIIKKQVSGDNFCYEDNTVKVFCSMY
jgi:hypothetical protein